MPAVATMRKRTLLVGAAGGVGSAALALLERHALGRRLLEGTGELLLLDRDPPTRALPARLADKARWLPPRVIESGRDLAGLLREHPVDEVIELAALGTWDCVEVCAEHGASYLNTCYDHWDEHLFRSVCLAYDQKWSETSGLRLSAAYEGALNGTRSSVDNMRAHFRQHGES